MCVEISYANGRDPIRTVGGPSGSLFGGGAEWRLPAAEVNRLLRTGRWLFFVNRPTASPPDRVAVRPVGTDFLTTEADGDYPNNLTALPAQDESVPIGLPQSPANFPPARTPTLIAVASQVPVTPRWSATATPDGTYVLLPSDYVQLRLEAPFSNLFEILVDGVGPLYQAPQGTTRLPDDQQRRGWWAFRSIGYFGNPPAGVSGMVQERDRTRYEIFVQLPEAPSRRRASVLIAQRSLNPSCPPSQQRSADLAIELVRPNTPVLVGSDGTAVPTSGVEQIVGWVQDGTDQFTFDAEVRKPALAGAVVTTVRNTTVDKNLRAVDLVNVRLTDELGASASDNLPAGAASGAFAGRRVRGRWSLRATNLSAALLEPRRVQLDVAWARP